MKKKIMALMMCVCMLAIAIAGGTMAYFTDTKSATNTMVFGDAKIELKEEQKDETGEMVPFDATSVTLMPAVFTQTAEGKIAVANKVDKYVSVKNTGKSEVYVRIIYAFEGTNAEVQDYIYAFVNDDENWDYNPVYNSGDNNNFAGARMIGTEKGNWTICEAVYSGPLASEATTEYSLKQFFLSPDADYDHTDDGVNNGIDTLFGENYEIKVIAQAVQVEGFAATAEKSASRVAVETAFGNLWDGEVTDQDLADMFGLGQIVQP